MANLKKYVNKREFLLDRLSMHIGSLSNLYSHSSNPPSPDEIFEKALEITEKIWDLGQRFDNFEELDDKLKQIAFEEYSLEERIAGQYFASELYSYLTGKIPPELFLNPPLPSEDELKRLYWGVIIHKGIQSIFGYKEKKYEISIGDGITIVGKPDLILENGDLIEIKTKEDIEIYEKPLPSWEYQIQCYLQMLNKNEAKLYLVGWGFSRKLFVIKRDDILWQRIVNGMKDYHQKVLKVLRETI